MPLHGAAIPASGGLGISKERLSQFVQDAFQSHRTGQFRVEKTLVFASEGEVDEIASYRCTKDRLVEIVPVELKGRQGSMIAYRIH